MSSIAIEKRTPAQQTVRYVLIAFGLTILNFAYVMVTVPHGIINGGVTSFSMILARLPLTEMLPVNAWVAIVTGLLALLCCIFLGRDIFIASLYSCVVGVAAFNFFTLIVPRSVIDTMVRIGYMGDNPVIPVGMALELIAAAAVVGAGYYFCLSNDSTAVGMDTIALILHKRNEKIPIAYAMYAINIIVLLLGLYTYGLRCVLMGIAFAGIQALALNTLLKLKGGKDKSSKGAAHAE
ncbi:MAG: YitT family protein [Firmicutes bacterium]|nr:YitT family protein [Bacillota bacterium]